MQGAQGLRSPEYRQKDLVNIQNSTGFPLYRLLLLVGFVISPMPTYPLPPGGGSLFFVHNNPSGTPQALTDENGKVVWTAKTAPFGATEVDEDPDGNGRSISFNIRAPGQYYDRDTGFHYNYFRQYDPRTGRYITSDPIGLYGGTNTYTYANNNPGRYIDPFGLDGFQGMVQGLTGMSPSQLPTGVPGQLSLLKRQNLDNLSAQTKRCVTTDFANPIPGLALEKGAQIAGRQFSQSAGQLAKDTVRKINKGVGATQLAVCLDGCENSCGTDFHQ